MPRSKIVNEQEVVRWFEEGRTYQWMTEEYKKKHNIEISLSAWGNFRRRRGLHRRITRNDDLIPWFIKPDHRWSYPITMLRAEARRRTGRELSPESAKNLAAWKQRMQENGVVLHYDPDTEQGFAYVPRREGIDTDLIRVPPRKTTRRKAAD